MGINGPRDSGSQGIPPRSMATLRVKSCVTHMLRGIGDCRGKEDIFPCCQILSEGLTPPNSKGYRVSGMKVFRATRSKGKREKGLLRSHRPQRFNRSRGPAGCLRNSHVGGYNVSRLITPQATTPRLWVPQYNTISRRCEAIDVCPI